MESVVKKSNKENTKPDCGPKKQVISNTVAKQRVLCKSAPFQSKNDLKEDNTEKRENDKTAVAKTRTNGGHHHKRQTLSQAFHTQQTISQRKLVKEVQKRPSSVTNLQIYKPGTYKGRVVQSKIDCYRKVSADVKTTERRKISKPEINSAKPALPKGRSKSVTSMPSFTKPKVCSAQPSRPKSVSEVPVNDTEKPVQKSVSHKQTNQKAPGYLFGAHQACFLPKPAPLVTGCSAFNKPALTRKKEIVVQGAKPKAAREELKDCRPVVSVISQYRFQVETAEERRAKLADWLATKGKSLKRPPIPETTRKPAMQTKTGPKSTTSSKLVIESAKLVEAVNTDKTNNVPGIKTKRSGGSKNVMNTTLDLLDNSDLDLPVDPEITMESLVLNLCDKLEEMETPSLCDAKNSQLAESEGKMQVEEQEMDKGFEIVEEEELVDEEDSKVGIKKDDDQEPRKKLFDSEEEDDCEQSCTSPEMQRTSIVKYNVKTTPYLQSMKKRLECEEAPGSGSRHKATIKDLKFLTPVRRSTRIQRKSSHLPDMLSDHDTCVSSLAELLQVEDADASAYIYRKNPALLQDLPEQTGDLAKVCI